MYYGNKWKNKDEIGTIERCKRGHGHDADRGGRVSAYLPALACPFRGWDKGIPVEVPAALADLYGVNVDCLIGRTDKKEMLPPSSGSAGK